MASRQDVVCVEVIRHRKERIGARFVLMLSLLFYLQSSHAMTLACGDVANLEDAIFSVGDAPVSDEPAKSLLGVNILFHIDDDKAWNEGLPAKLRQLGLSSLRFPGGEVADRYDWETGGRDNARVTDKESPAEAAGYTDYLEFLERAKAAGIADIYFVVNLESAFLAPGDRDENVRRYAGKAARWVAEVRRRGYRVKYWEIGNESYLDGTTFPLTAAEYADALSVFSGVMKQADPSIVIAANGPSGEESNGFADKLTREQLEFFRGKGRKLCGRKPDKDCIVRIREAVPGIEKPEPWWGVVSARAGNDFDMAVIHSYSRVKLPKRPDGAGLRELKQVRRLRAMLERKTGREIAVSVTEWNVPPKRRETLARGAAALSNVVKLGNYMAAGVEHAHLWPLRYPGTESEVRMLLTMEGLEITPMYRALEAVAPVMNAAFGGQEVLANGVYALQTTATDGERVALVNAGNHARAVHLQLAAGTPHGVKVHQLSGDSMSGGEICGASGALGDVSISLPPGSLTTVILTQLANPI